MVKSKRVIRERTTGISVFQYSCHRKYLSDCLNDLRERNTKLSYQKLMEELQLSSKSQVFRLLKAEPFVLPKELVYRICNYLGLDKRAAEFFHLLVAFGESESETDRLFFFEQLQKVARPIAKSRFSGKELEYFSEWYVPVVRELMTNPDLNYQVDVVASQIIPPVSVEKVREAVLLLEELGMIRKEGEAYYQQQVAIVPDPDLRSLIIRGYQLRHLRVTEEALKQSEIKDQHLGAITFSVNTEGERRIREKISDFLSEVISIASQYESSHDRVMQLNLQLFPVSKKTDKK